MASLAKFSNRTFAIQFPLDGRRRTISLANFSERQARAIKAHVENIISALASNTAIPADTSNWLREISDKLHAKLASAKLVQPRAAARLGPFFQAFIDKRMSLKPNTIKNIEDVQRFAIKHFGKDRELRLISRGDVQDWRRLLAEEYAEATVAMHVKKMRQLYQDAIDHELVSINPFRAVKAGSMTNSSRQRYVTLAEIEKVIDACPNDEWRLLFALARHAGLRIPSEINQLRFDDINWEHGRFTVQSPKTERHAGKDKRIVPIFPALAPFLLTAQERAAEGQTRLFPTLRGENLRTTAHKIIKRAGLIPWPRLFQNLRASCETDLATKFPLHVACAWIGNSANVAMRSYLQVHDAFFTSAAEIPASTTAVSAGQHRTVSEHAMQNHSVNTMKQTKSMPLVGGESPTDSNVNPQKAHEVLQRVLHPVTRNAEKGGRHPNPKRALRRIADALKKGGRQ